MRKRPFENGSEMRTRRVLEHALRDCRHYRVNAKTRLEDVVLAEPGDSEEDRRFIRNAHLDYRIHRDPANEVLWVIEFDGPQHRDDPLQIDRDIRKNRILAQAGIPILRIDDEYLVANDELTLLEWLVRRWIAYDKALRVLLEERAAGVAKMAPGELNEVIESGASELDVELLFDLEHPFPPLRAIATRLLTAYGICDPVALGFELRPEGERQVRWHLDMPRGGPLPDLNDHGFHSRTSCEVELRPAQAGPDSEPVLRTCGEYLARVGYPIRKGQRSVFDIVDPETREPVAPPAGPPYGGSAWATGPTLAHYKALVEVERWAKRNLSPAPRIK